jgi:hypothetical protein
MKRMHHVHGTKERPPGRQCLTFTIAGDGLPIVDRVHPEDRGEMFARLWGHYGRGNIWVSYRRMERHEEYIQFDGSGEVA